MVFCRYISDQAELGGHLVESHQTAGRSDQIMVDYFTSSVEDRGSLVLT